jgi:hypothetical protein
MIQSLRGFEGWSNLSFYHESKPLRTGERSCLLRRTERQGANRRFFIFLDRLVFAERGM